MSAYRFLTDNTDKVQKIINKMSHCFDSHDFIEELACLHTGVYVDMLAENLADIRSKQGDERDVFQNVHSQIGSFLKNHKADLHIEDLGKGKSRNVHGKETENRWWRRTKK